MALPRHQRSNAARGLTALAIVLAGAVAPGAAALLAQAPAVRQAISREVTLANTFAGPGDEPLTRQMVSREITIANTYIDEADAPDLRQAISREVSIAFPVADLIVETVTASPPEGLAARPYSVAWRVRNLGPAATEGSWVDRLYLSQDASVGNDTLLGEVAYGGDELAAGSSYVLGLALNFPLVPGQYWLVVEAGVGSSLGETNDLNNRLVSASPLHVVQPPLPDLVVTDVVGPQGAALAATTTEVSFVVSNSSANPTYVPAWMDNLFLVSSSALAPYLTQEPHALGQFANPIVLPPGESYAQTVRVTLPPKTEGIFQIAVYADSRRSGAWRRGDPFDQSESDEANNWLFSAPFELRVSSIQPDLRARQIAFLPEASSSRALDVSWSDENAGTGPTESGSWRDAVYLSADAASSVSPGDILLANKSRSGAPLDPGGASPLGVRPVLPASLSGTFRVKIAVDDGDAICEYGHEQNNVAVSTQPLTVIQSPAVDLTPIQVTAPPVAYPGHSIDVAWIVRNVGAPPLDLALYWQDAVYLSHDDVRSADDVLLGRVTRATSRDGEGRVVFEEAASTATVRVPNATAAGTYRLIVVVDELDGVFEGVDAPGPADDGLKERNNVRASGPVDVRSQSADLDIEIGFDAAHPLPEPAAAEQEIQLSWRVRNAGAVDTPIAHWIDAVYLSIDGELGPGDALLASAGRSGALEPGASYDVTRSATVPRLAPGGYFLLYVTDIYDQAFELPPADANNVAAASFTVTPDGPDLALTAVAAPPSAAAGTSVRVTWSGRNGGTLATGLSLWSDRVYLSEDDALDSGDRLLGARSQAGPLEPGDFYDAAATFTLPSDTGGILNVLVVADADGNVYERDETNNTRIAASKINIQPRSAPSLVVRDVRIVGSILSGQRVDVRWTVENAGTGPTIGLSWTDAVFLSGDRFFDPTFDLYLGATVHSGTLAPGQRYDSGGVFDVPLGVSGSFYVFVVVDRDASGFDGVVVGSPASTTGSFPIALPLPSDLEVIEVVPPATGGAGSLAHVTWRVANVGGAAVQGRWTDALFLSRDAVFDLDDVFLGGFPSEVAAPMAAGTSQLFFADAVLPSVPPGNYHVLVRVDALNQVPDPQGSNDLAASAGTIAIGVPSLVLNAPPLSVDLASGDERLFELETPAFETVKITLEHESDAAWTELFVRFEAVPSPGLFDFRFDSVGQPRQVVVLPETREGKYYVLARAVRGAFSPGGQKAEVSARTVPFSVDAVSPRSIGDAGRATLTVRGSQFVEQGGVFLENLSGSRKAALHVERIDASLLRATFDLDGVSRGRNTLVVTRPGQEARLDGAVVVESVAPPLLEIADPDPPALREGASAGTLELKVVNLGNVDAEYVFLGALVDVFSGAEVLQARSSSPYSALTEHDGLFEGSAIIRSLAPGETARLWLTARAAGAAEGAFDVGLVGALLDTRAFLRFADGAADALRTALLQDPSLAAVEARKDLLELAQDAEAWRAYTRSRLVAAGLLSPPDTSTPAAAAGATVPGQARCVQSAALPQDPASFCRDEGILCNAWLEGLLPVSASALGGLSSQPPAGTAARVVCDPASMPGCAACTLWRVKQAIDPNEKTGSDGASEEQFVPAGQPIKYRIYFENVASATGPAALVRITDPLDPALNPGSVRFGDVAFGSTIVSVPEGSIFYQERRALDFDPGLALDIVAGVDALRNEVFWTLRTVDRETGLVPTDADRGFLAVSDATGSGLGWVEFSVAPTPAEDEKIIIKNEACIIFDANEPLETNPVQHTVDPAAPSSSMTPLPALSDGPSLHLAWSGSDSPGGSGVSSFTVYVSRDDGPFVPFLADTAKTSAEYPSPAGHRYAFFTVARDHAGNEEARPDEPSAETVVAGGAALFRRGDMNGDTVLNITDAIFFLAHLFLGGLEPPCADATDANDDAIRDISDAVYLLRYLFLGGADPLPPGPRSCGPDPTPDTLGPCLDPSGACEL